MSESALARCAAPDEDDIGLRADGVEPEKSEDAKPELSSAPPPSTLLTIPASRALCYMAAAVVLSLSQGLGMNAVSVNVNQIQGSFGVTQTEATWLMAAYMAPNVSLSLILIKMRMQFGLRRFAEVSILIFVIVSAVHLYVNDYQSALVLRFFAGVAASPMSSLGFLYMLEPFAPVRKMNLGLGLALTNIAIAAPAARLISPSLLDLGQWHAIYTVELGLALIALVMVYLLPLTSPPRAKVISIGDIISYLLIAVSFGCLAVVLTVGRLYWWFEAPWIAGLLAITAVTLTAAVIIELNRASPLVDIRWLASGPVLHFAGAILLLRLLTSEQTAGAVPFMTQLGLLPPQMTIMWVMVLLVSVSAGPTCAIVMKPGREPIIHALALVLIGTGAFLDSQSTNLTRPLQLLMSQALISAGTAIFLPPAMASGIMMALKKGPNYMLSFVVIFLSTQSLGGLAGSALHGTFVTIRERYHSSHLVEHLSVADPFVAQRIAQLSGTYGKVLQDKTALATQGLQALAQQTTKEAYVLAYNDLFLLTAIGCAVALVILIMHVSVNSLRAAFASAQPQT